MHEFQLEILRWIYFAVLSGAVVFALALMLYGGIMLFGELRAR